MTFDDVIFCDKSNKKNYKDLKDKCRKEIIIPFVGAGLSIPPYLGWSESLMELVDTCDDKVKNHLKALLADKEFERAADFVVESLGKGQFERNFRDLFDDNKIKNIGISNSMRLLPHIFPNAVITTNFDKCIECAYRENGNPFSSIITPKDASSLNNYLSQISRSNSHFLWKLHGDIDCFEMRVFTSKEYDKTYRTNTDKNSAIYSFFQNNQIIFLGCSLNGNDRYMRILKELGEKNDMTNFAILQKPESETEYERQKKSLSDHWVFPIWYPANDKSHESVCIILRQLIEDMAEENGDVTDINATFSRNSVPEFIENQMKAKGITLTTHKEEISRWMIWQRYAWGGQADIHTLA